MPIQIGSLKLYALKELSEKLNVTTVTLRAYIKEGKLVGQKVGGKWMVSEKSLEEFFNGRPREKSK